MRFPVILTAHGGGLASTTWMDAEITIKSSEEAAVRQMQPARPRSLFLPDASHQRAEEMRGGDAVRARGAGALGAADDAHAPGASVSGLGSDSERSWRSFSFFPPPVSQRLPATAFGDRGACKPAADVSRLASAASSAAEGVGVDVSAVAVVHGGGGEEAPAHVAGEASLVSQFARPSR